MKKQFVKVPHDSFDGIEHEEWWYRDDGHTYCFFCGHPGLWFRNISADAYLYLCPACREIYTVVSLNRYNDVNQARLQQLGSQEIKDDE